MLVARQEQLEITNVPVCRIYPLRNINVCTKFDPTVSVIAIKIKEVILMVAGGEMLGDHQITKNHWDSSGDHKRLYNIHPKLSM